MTFNLKIRIFCLFASLNILHFPALANSAKCQDLFQQQKSTLLSPLESAEKFRAYFNALNETLVERSEVLRLIQVALISQEHVLLMGPPGNAKSMVADMVLGGITEQSTGKNSYYRIQMTPETSMSETHGPINPKEIFETGRIVREYDQGMLFSRNVFIDEIFDARANAQRNILGLLAERQHAQGTDIVPGKIETVIGATNRYLDEVYEKAGDQGPKALLDRFSFNIYVPGEFNLASSYSRLITSAKKNQNPLPQLSFDHLEDLRGLVSQVEITEDVAQFLSLLSFQMKSQTESMEQADLKSYRKKIQQGETPSPPYRATKYHSPRTLYKAAGILKAFVVYDWVQKNGQRPLRTTLDDIKMLKEFFILSGPDTQFVEAMLERTSNPYERSQLSIILEEAKIFDTIYGEISRQTNDIIYQYALEDLEQITSKISSSAEKEKMLLHLVQIWIETNTNSQAALQADLSGMQIGYSSVASYVKQKISSLTSIDFESLVKQKVLEIEKAVKREQAIQHQKTLREGGKFFSQLVKVVRGEVDLEDSELDSLRTYILSLRSSTKTQKKLQYAQMTTLVAESGMDNFFGLDTALYTTDLESLLKDANTEDSVKAHAALGLAILNEDASLIQKENFNPQTWAFIVSELRSWRLSEDHSKTSFYSTVASSMIDYDTLSNMTTKQLEAYFKDSFLDVNVGLEDNDSLLHAAISNDDIGFIKKLLSLPDIDPNLLDHNGMSPLKSALQSEQKDVVDLLLKHEKIDVNAKDGNGISLLHWIASNYGDSPSVLKILKHPKMDINAIDDQGHSALFYVLSRANYSFAKHLLKVPNIDPNIGFPVPILQWADDWNIPKEIINLIRKHPKMDASAAPKTEPKERTRGHIF